MLFDVTHLYATEVDANDFTLTVFEHTVLFDLSNVLPCKHAYLVSDLRHIALG